jgi:hypothetical protein
MKTVEETYGDRFFRKRNSLSWRVPLVCDAILKAYPEIKSVYDCGCAIGDYVNGFNARRLMADGFEGSEAVLPHVVDPNVFIRDLRIPIEAPPHDLCMSFEVAEHIETEYANVYVRNLCYLSDNVLITAAPPGQLGVGHVNCQYQSYWIDLFKKLDFCIDHHIINIIRNEWEDVKRKKGMNAYYANLLAFRRSKDGCANDSGKTP